MIYQVLNGDALKTDFISIGLDGELVVAREALISGSLNGDTLSGFYETRAAYFEITSNEERPSYYAKTVSEFNKLITAPGGSEINLWFGYDLFCQCNMWFVLSLLDTVPTEKEIFVVYPAYLKNDQIWNDFGGATPADLLTSFKNRIRFGNEDLQLGKKLWESYKSKDLAGLKKLSLQHSVCFPYLEIVCQAHIDRFPKTGKGRPEKVIEEILQRASGDFHSVFAKFYLKEGIYGFGDTQFREIYDKVLSDKK